MTREEILKKAGLSPQAFCPGCWHNVKKILRLFEETPPVYDSAGAIKPCVIDEKPLKGSK
jgi:hypothetical protein